MNREGKMYATVGQQVTLHLVAWCHHQFPRDPQDAFDKMSDYLLAQDADETARLLDLGWWNVYDKMTAAKGGA